MLTKRQLNWTFGIAIALLLTLLPLIHFRANYHFSKRLRVVTEGKIYRSGCLTASGFEAAIREYGIRTVLNLQEEAPDPDLPIGYLDRDTEKESELCDRLGVRYEFLKVDLQPPESVPPARPKAIESYFRLLDDSRAYPILIHCRAGLHRTGVLVALYRMEYEGWSVFQATEEMRALGFGRTASFSPNEYVRQYLANYQPRQPQVRLARGTRGLSAP